VSVGLGSTLMVMARVGAGRWRVREVVASGAVGGYCPYCPWAGRASCPVAVDRHAMRHLVASDHYVLLPFAAGVSFVVR
jgi:hypothetical protein